MLLADASAHSPLMQLLQSALLDNAGFIRLLNNKPELNLACCLAWGLKMSRVLNPMKRRRALELVFCSWPSP